MQYQVPQFIEIEDKIFGPLTFRQFVYVAGGAAICFLAYRFLPIYLSIFIIVPMGGFSLALAFYKVNNRPFIEVVESALRFALGNKLYIWKKTDTDSAQAQRNIAVDPSKVLVPKLSNSKLKELTWSLDINNSIYSKDSGFKSRDEIHPENKTSISDSDELTSFKGLSTDILNRR